MTYAKCKMMGRTVEFKLLPTSKHILVGVSGRLVGSYETPRLALFEAAEHVRLVEHSGVRPSVPQRTIEAVENFNQGE